MKGGIRGDVGAAPGAGFGQLGAGLQHVQRCQRGRGLTQRGRLRQHLRRQLGQNGRLPGGGTFGGFGNATVKLGQLGVAEAGSIGHRLAQAEFGIAAQRVRRRRRHLQDVAQLGMVADLERRHAVALSKPELQPGNDPAAIVAQLAFGIEFAIEPCGNGSLTVGRRLLHQCAAEPFGKPAIDLQSRAQPF